MPGARNKSKYLPIAPNTLKRSPKKLILAVIVATGVSSVVSQLLCIRELLSQFSGNEYLISLIIFIWLIFGGLGTLLSQTVSRFLRSTPKRLGCISLVLVGLSPLQILAIRFLREIFFIPGSAVGFYPTLGFTLVTVGPYALLVGFVLPYSLFVIRNLDSGFSGTMVYITDNIGDVSGGAIFSFLLVYLFSPLQSLFLANLPPFILCIFLIPRDQRIRPVFILFFGIILLILTGGVIIEKAGPYDVQGKTVYLNETKYGRIRVIKDSGQYTLYNQGEPFYSTQNSFSAEEIVHYPLSQLKTPRNILLISAQSKILQEVHKYSAQNVYYVEIDPVLTRVQFKFGFLEKIPELKVINQDARNYLYRTDKTFDAIISSLPEPETFRTNRYYTKEFFELVKEHLSPKGIWSFSVQGFANYLSSPARKKISSLYQSAQKYFENVQLLPGKNTFFLCSDSPIDTNIPQLLRKKDIDTEFLQFYYPGNVTRERIKSLEELVLPKMDPNTDLEPTLMQIMFSQWFYKHGTSPAVFYSFLGILGIVYLACISREEFVLFSTGFMNMGSEILLIFAFQIFFGYVYYLVGLIVTVFLAGMLPGAFLGQILRRYGNRLLLYTDLGLIILLVFFLLCIIYIGGGLPAIFFLGTGFLLSVFCGFQFPVALEIRQERTSAATRFFSADIIGAAAGALSISVIMLPFLGIVWTIWGLVGMKTASLVLNGVNK